MRVLALIVLGLFSSSGSHGSVIDNKVDEEPHREKLTLPEQYHMKGSLYLPYAELEEPIEVWVDMKSQKSRIDYYHGMMKVYQYGLEGKYGTLKEVIPVTKSRDEKNIATCKQIDGTDDSPYETQQAIPDPEGFKMVGRELIMGHVCEKWQLNETKYTRVNTYTFYVRRHNGKTIPVKYQMHGFNGLFDSHYDHYYIYYSEFNHGLESSSVFEIDPELQCPGHNSMPHQKLLHAYNPLKELINRDESHIDHAFENFKGTHKKEYKKENEHELRRHNFKQNMRFIHSKNREGLPYTLGVNPMADLSQEEMKVMNGRKYDATPRDPHTFTYTAEDVAGLPDHIDWRIAGAVTPVKDQATCGSCWAFGAVGAIEGAYFLKYGQRLAFSEQALVDCSWGFHNGGCDGGMDYRAFEFIKKNGGLPTDQDYGPYLGIDGYCHIWNTTKSVMVDGYKEIKEGDEDGLMVALHKYGPISIAIDANPLALRFYASGVFYDPTCRNKSYEVNHAVLLVGYGTLHGKPYWLVKNSWSTHWGNDGYVLFSRGNDNCGVAASPTFPILQ